MYTDARSKATNIEGRRGFIDLIPNGGQPLWRMRKITSVAVGFERRKHI
jgi:hypothetical protein